MYPYMIVWVPISYFEDEVDNFGAMRYYRTSDESSDFKDNIAIFEMIDEEFVEEELKSKSNK